MQAVFYRIQTQGSGGGLAVWLRYLFGFEKVRSIHPASLLEMKVEEILVILSHERKNRGLWRYLSIFLGLDLGVVLPLCMLHWHVTVGIWPFYALMLPLSFFASRKVASQKHQAAAAAISRFDDLRAVGPLAEALEFQHKEVVPFAERALIRLLPRLMASDSSLLNAQQRACLNRALKRKGVHDDMRVAILKAWEQVGDAAAIPFVETVARGESAGGRIPAVAAAARECLPFLVQSTQRRQIGSQLLRPADVNGPSPEVLLRPSMPHASVEPPDQLLRPTNDAD